METLIYNNHNIEITTDGTTNFIYIDHQERIAHEYDYDELSYFTEDIQYLPEYVAIELLSALDKYYDNYYVSGTLTFTVDAMPKEAWHELLRTANQISNKYHITYESDIQ